MKRRIFLLSPAHCGGKRAGLVFRPGARFELARKLRTPAGATIGETFTFLSGLYFRGKLEYARRFGSPPVGMAGAYAITTNRGLLTCDTAITLAELEEMGRVAVNLDEPKYRLPLEDRAREIAHAAGDSEVVLLGSVASDKYVEVLSETFGSRLMFPKEFAGRGDMSRGGLMLRCVREGHELEYVPLTLACFRGVTARKSGAR
jgi:hypothetical protein